MSLALIVLVSFIVFGRAIFGEFLFDDPAIWDMTEPADRNAPREEWKAGGGAAGVFRLPNNGRFRGFCRQPRAMTGLTYYWTWRAFRFRPFGWHLFNLLAHAVNICLVYILAGFILNNERALIAAWIFGVHPHQAASVCYVSGRAAILATLFTLCAFVLILQGGFLCLFLAALSAFLAVKSKQDAPVYWLFFPVLWLYSR